MEDDGITVLKASQQRDTKRVHFSLIGLYQAFQKEHRLDFGDKVDIILHELKSALLFLQKIEALHLEGGFMVFYQSMAIQRLNFEKKAYSKKDYQLLENYYTQKIQQIHIVGEFAQKMQKSASEALQFVQDYFYEPYDQFLRHYFKNRLTQISRSATPELYDKLQKNRSAQQLDVLQAKERYIVVAAGPGSGKTRILVHKLAYLRLIENYRDEQLLMLTFTRSAAMEFRQRLRELSSTLYRIPIKTFHSFAFDLLDRVGSLDDVNEVIQKATQRIETNNVEPSRIAKKVVVIDEAQDMSAESFALLRALAARNAQMHIIAVGDDDQCIFEYAGADAQYFQQLARIGQDGQGEACRQLELSLNYRSNSSIVEFSNHFATHITKRLKTQPIEAINTEPGTVHITRYRSEHLEEPVVEELLQHYRDTKERIGILTFTNEMAWRIATVIKDKGLLAKLVGTNHDFKPVNLAELRFFRDYLQHTLSAHNADQLAEEKISEKIWQQAQEALCERFRHSQQLSACLSLLESFSEEHDRRRYLTDLDIFLNQVQLEDGMKKRTTDPVSIMTIHKAKGREFDKVFLVLDRPLWPLDDTKRRLLYVAISRAKNALFIHTRDNLFSSEIQAGLASETLDNMLYDEPQHFCLELGLKDVNLGSFYQYQKTNIALVSGTPLLWDDQEDRLLGKVDSGFVPVGYLSQKGRQQLKSLLLKGYRIEDLQVAYQCWWRDPYREQAPDILVILPRFTFKRQE